MSSYEARDGLGSLLRKVREKKGLDIETLAQRTGLQVEVIVKLEHGVVNPTRSDFQKIIVALALPKKLRGKAGQLLGIIHPQKKKKSEISSALISTTAEKSAARISRTTLKENGVPPTVRLGA